jgi:N-methylhydantoinase A
MAFDIGGTFTDVVLEIGAHSVSAKVLTTQAAPEIGALEGILSALGQANIKAGDVELLIHGTTLATNAIIERKGAVTALVTTDGFRDSLEMAYENRFDQYDVFVEKPKPLVPRALRLTVPERVDARGQVRVPLDEAAVEGVARELARRGIESVAIGLIHSYANPRHEQRIREILAAALPGVSLSLSSEVCPEIREYERLSTTCANAYVQPKMATYLARLEQMLADAGFRCPMFLMTSGGGLTTFDTAKRLPIRLVESGPAGGAILASHIAAQCGLDRLMSFDMGGTTAKICLIDGGVPQKSRLFEVDRQYRFAKGSGLPLRIPVIEMVEIGAGGGSIASIDAARRIAVGPESAASSPGPACYGIGGTEPTVTDADLLLGRIDPENFAGGNIRLAPDLAQKAVARAIAARTGLDVVTAAFGIAEIVEENMAGASRVHAVERGKTLTDRTMVAFGGAAPLHAARVAEKLGISEVIVPSGAGVGSAVGFLRAPIAFELVRSRYMRVGDFDHRIVNALFDEMAREAHAEVRRGAPDSELVETRTADMRYCGQGHEVVVTLPARPLHAQDAALLRDMFEHSYRQLYARIIPGLDIEALSWTLAVSTRSTPPAPVRAAARAAPPAPAGMRRVFDPLREAFIDMPVYRREALKPGAEIAGPALIAEAQTTTFVTARFSASIDALGYIRLVANGSGTP